MTDGDWSFRLDDAPTTLASIEVVERRLGVRLPVAYQRILTQVGNGGPVRTVRPQEFSSDVGLDAVYGVDRGDRHDLEGVVERMVGHRLPAWIIPFGDSPGGNLVCFSVGDTDADTVWFWDHEYELSGSALTQVAASIDEFLAGLHEAPPSPGGRVVSVTVRDPEWLRRMQDEQRARREHR